MPRPTYCVLFAVVMAAAAATMAVAQQPEQQHLAFAAPGSMTVSWVTLYKQPTAPVARYISRAASRELADGGWQEVAAETRAIGDGNCSHHAIMTGLSYGVTYVYIVGDASTGQFSANQTFLYDMLPGDDTTFTIGVVGDMGIAPYGNGTAARLIQHADEFNWILHVGDLAYADDRKDSKEVVAYNGYFNRFGREISPVARNIAYMVCSGNHEVFCHSEGRLVGQCPEALRNFTSYNARHRMPGKDSGSSNDNMWFSFDYGKAHFIALDTETDYPDAPETKWEFDQAGGFGDQIGWLKADLAKAVANRDKIPWIVVYGHRPLYTTQKEGFDRLIWNNATGILRAAIEDLMYDAHVDLYISGHVHAYERMLPMYRGEITDYTYNNPRGITSVIVGHAGNIEGHACSWKNPQPAWEPVRTCAEFGYGRMAINATHLKFDMFFSPEDSLQDTFVISKLSLSLSF